MDSGLQARPEAPWPDRSAAEASYLLGLSQRPGYVTAAFSDELAGRYEELRRDLQSMIKRFEPEIASRSRRP